MVKKVGIAEGKEYRYPSEQIKTIGHALHDDVRSHICLAFDSEQILSNSFLAADWIVLFSPRNPLFIETYTYEQICRYIGWIMLFSIDKKI